MKSKFMKILLFVFVMTMALSLCSCEELLGNLPFDIPGLSGPDNGENKVPTDTEDLYLFFEGQPQFQVVYASEGGNTLRNLARTFVAELRKKGYEINDPVSDADADAVVDCEILVGPNIKNRGEECCISDKYLGKNGKTIKVVGNKLVIAGGTTDATTSIFDNFMSKEMGLNKTIDANFSVKRDYFYETLTNYYVTSIKINGNDLGLYTLVMDVDDMSEYDTDGVFAAFREQLYNSSGYWMPVGTAAEIDSYDYKFIVRYLDSSEVEALYNPAVDYNSQSSAYKNMKEYGFSARVDGNDFIVECAYSNAFATTFANFAKNRIYNKRGDLTFASNFIYNQEVCKVYYEDYGAKGDGKTDDFEAIKAAHEYANIGGQLVTSRRGADANYYINEKFTSQIIVKTDVDFNNCTFTINDRASVAHENRSGLFRLERDHEDINLVGEAISDLNGGVLPEIHIGDTELPWLSNILTDKSLVAVINKHRDFIRHGANQSIGSYRRDMFIVTPDGKIAEDTPVIFEFTAGSQTNYKGVTSYYDSINQVLIYNTNDKPITVKNGNFVNICCVVRAETAFKNKFDAYRRGLDIFRSNVTIENMDHKIEQEPYFNPQGAFGQYGDCSESYPYYGFFYMETTHNLLIKDSVITGHTTYYEDKPATDSTGGVKPNPVPMGSYDFVAEYSSNVTFMNVIQRQYYENALGDTRYWGIMSSNGSKNINMYDTYINRFDAHRGFWNATLVDSIIGRQFHLVGGGTFYAENVTKVASPEYITARGDYGGIFDGTIELVDCHHNGEVTYNSVKGQVAPTTKYPSITIFNSGFDTTADKNANTSYWNWDFGFECAMPSVLTIDNFTTDTEKMYVFNNLPNDIFLTPENGGIKNTYRITEKVIFQNMDNVPLCESTDSKYSMIRNINTVNQGTVEKEKLSKVSQKK